jgi:hypothetical protein
MMRILVLLLAALALPDIVSGQTTRVPLTTTDRLQAHNTTVDAVTFKGRRAVRVAIAPEVARRPEYVAGTIEPEAFVRVDGLTFASGVIEVEVASAPAAGAYPGARGFAGVAFRLQAARDSADAPTYDAFYLRPTNGRATDQERRNHAVQYIAHPEWTWSRLRRDTPSRYEAYVDLVPDVWTTIRIEVRGAQAKLFVHGQTQPTLIVNDVKSGPSATGAVALWIGPGTVAHFRNLRVTPE